MQVSTTCSLIKYVFRVALNISGDLACLVQSEGWWKFSFLLNETMLMVTRPFTCLDVCCGSSCDETIHTRHLSLQTAMRPLVTWDGCQRRSPPARTACRASRWDQYPVPTQMLNQTCLGFRAAGLFFTMWKNNAQRDTGSTRLYRFNSRA